MAAIRDEFCFRLTLKGADSGEDAEDVVFQALQSSPPSSANTPPSDAGVAKDMVELFAPLRGLNIDFECDRSGDTGRDINL